MVTEEGGWHQNGAIEMEIELEGEVAQEMGQIEDHGHYFSLDVKCPTTHKNTPKGNEVGEPLATIVSRINNSGKIATHIPLPTMTSQKHMLTLSMTNTI